ncbi:MAG: N-acetylmuramic acid 6-phosphate etherase [Planctomycetota bacterium]|nr:N-acetylmuramic acid 6-phosphate etherase [Planctomycetota bacterium]
MSRDSSDTDRFLRVPPDRGAVGTEQRNTQTMDLHRLSVEDCVARIQAADHDVLTAVEQARPAIARFIEAAEPGFRDGGRLVYFGAGTSGRLAVLDASEAPPTFQVPRWRVVGIIAGGDNSLRKSSESKEDDPKGAIEELLKLGLGPKDAVIGIAAGGTTPYVRGGLAWCAARSEPPLTALLSCSQCQKPPGVGHLLCVDTGPEVLTGSTRMKAGTATKLVLNTISTTLMIRSGRVYQNLMVDLKASNDKLRDRAARIVASITGLDRSASFALLDRAGGRVKCAVVMHHLGCGRTEAELALADCDDRLDLALGQ